MTARTEKLVLIALVLMFVVLCGLYNRATPAFAAFQHNPDENAHILYVQSIAEGHLPVFRVSEANYEAHQPPLYYTLCVPVYALARGNNLADATHAVRWVSTLLGVLLIMTTWAVVRGAFGGGLLPLASAGFVALLPMNISLCASVTNDAFANLVCVLALLCVVKMTQNVNTRRWTLLLGVTLGIGIWTKTSTLVLWPAILVTCFLLARYKLWTAKDAARAAAVSLGVGLTIGLPWLVRNTVLYGDPVAQHVFQSAFGQTAQAAPFVKAFGWPIYLTIVAQWTFASFWGVFDSMTLFWGQGARTPSPFAPLPPPYGAFGIATVAALVGVRGFLQKQHFTPVQRTLLWTFATLILFTFLAHGRFVLTYFQAQGRYWFPALVPLTFFFCAGWESLAGKTYKVVLLVLGTALFVLNVYTACVLLPVRFAAP